MPFFAVTYTYTDDRARQDEVRPEHRAFLRGLVDQGLLFASGPLLGTDPGQALLVLKADDADEVVAALDADPFHLQGQIRERNVQQWNPVVGALADQA